MSISIKEWMASKGFRGSASRFGPGSWFWVNLNAPTQVVGVDEETGAVIVRAWYGCDEEDGQPYRLGIDDMEDEGDKKPVTLDQLKQRLLNADPDYPFFFLPSEEPIDCFGPFWTCTVCGRATATRFNIDQDNAEPARCIHCLANEAVEEILG